MNQKEAKEAAHEYVAENVAERDDYVFALIEKTDKCYAVTLSVGCEASIPNKTFPFDPPRPVPTKGVMVRGEGCDTGILIVGISTGESCENGSLVLQGGALVKNWAELVEKSELDEAVKERNHFEALSRSAHSSKNVEMERLKKVLHKANTEVFRLGKIHYQAFAGEMVPKEQLDEANKEIERLDRINDIHKQRAINFAAVYRTEEPKMCCSGFECGCLGQPIDPPYCSKECMDKAFGRDKK